MGTKHTRTFKLVTCCFTWDLLDVLVVAYVHTHADTHTHVNREKGWLLSSLSGALFSVSFSSFTSAKVKKINEGTAFVGQMIDRLPRSWEDSCATRLVLWVSVCC